MRVFSPLFLVLLLAGCPATTLDQGQDDAGTPRPPQDSVGTSTATDSGPVTAVPLDAGIDLSSNPPDVRYEASTNVGKGSFAGIWAGDIDLEAPGFYGPPIDRFVVAFANGRLSSFAFDKFAQTQIFGDASASFPLQGSRVVQPQSAGGDTHTVTVLESSWTETSFSLKYRAVSTGLSDFEESLKGAFDGNRLRVEYAIKGKLRGATVDAHASGTLICNDDVSGRTRQTTPGKWAGDINVVSPGFAGGPIDRFVVSINEDNELAYFQFHTTGWGHQFGTAPGDFPLHGTSLVTGGTTNLSFVSQVEEATFTPTSFSFRHHVVGSGKETPGTDYVETFSGTIVNGQLDITYTMKGTILVAPIDKKAWGTLTAEP